MNVKNLMSGIAVIIDDAYEEDGNEEDKIFELVQRIENEWNIPCYKTHKIPSAEVVNNLLQSASFILLDWKLWPSGADELQQSGIEDNIRFLKRAKGCFVPVFIFTNENKHDVVQELNQDLYDDNNPGKGFIFIEKKEILLSDFSRPVEEWLQGNASVYTLKAWEQAFHKAKGNLYIRPDCDCVPRCDGQEDIELYCIKGKCIGPSEIERLYDKGHFNERVFESIVFAGHNNRTIKFNFSELHLKKYADIKDQYVGRLIHPHITRIQQRYSAYLQRQGLPRIPEEAITKTDGKT